MNAAESNQNSGGGYYGSQAQSNRDTGQKTFEVHVEFKRPGEILPNELSAQVEFTTAPYQSRSCIPWNAIVVKRGKPYVKLYGQASGYSEIPIVIGRRNSEYVELLSPLPENTSVISKLW